MVLSNPSDAAMPSALCAVILAAGASTRMGRSKADLLWHGTSFVAHCVQSARAALAHSEPLFIIEGAHPLGHLVDPLIDLPGSPLERLEHGQWSRGPLSSLQLGLAQPRARGRACLVLTIDRPHVAPSTLEALVTAHRRQPQALLQPSYASHHGHPIVWPADLCEQLLALSPDSTPRELVRRPDVTSRRCFIDVDDRSVLDNIDDPAAYDRLRALPR